MGPVRNNKGQVFYRIELQECNSGIIPDDISMRIRLEVPYGINYDLILYDSEWVPIGSSKNGTGVEEVIEVTITDTWLIDDDEVFYIEVDYVYGSSCDSWTLKIFGHID